MKFDYRMHFSKTGRARYVAHLDTLSCLVRAIRRAGFNLAYTEGMRPKPVLSLAMPLGVGIEGEDEICDFALKQRAPLTELAKRIGSELPEGIELKSVGPTLERTKSAARVEALTYRILLKGAPPGLQGAIERYNDADKLEVLRKRPKGDKTVDVKRYIGKVSPLDDGSGIEFEMVVTEEGTARPEEVMELLSRLSEHEIATERITRVSIKLKEETPSEPPRRRPPAGRHRRPRRR